MIIYIYHGCPFPSHMSTVWLNEFAHSMNQWEACISFSSRCSSRSRSISLTPSRKVPQLQPTMVDDDIAPLEAMGRPSVLQLNPKSLREFAMCTCKKITSHSWLMRTCLQPMFRQGLTIYALAIQRCNNIFPLKRIDSFMSMNCGDTI